MSNCKLIDELNRLRKSSGESIDNDKEFDTFKQYMHVQRAVEEDLKSKLRNINKSDRKTLVLLCGSAGDGKSHMLSYLKNYDEENLLDGYRIHNDATESSAPNKTAIETLNEVLHEFSDVNINEQGQNLILAINLGVLNNFIESDYGMSFHVLKQYVEDHYILSSKIVDNNYDPDSSIQHVSFADYHMYTLKETGAESSFILSLMDKIYGNQKDNPFLNAYHSECENCIMKKYCPVKHNYSFLQLKSSQEYVVKTLIMTIIKEKEILTTREILNYFYDITVPQDFTRKKLEELMTDTEKKIKYYIKGMTPSLLFGQTDVSSLIDHVRMNDPVLYRDEKSDDFAVEYNVSTNIHQIIKNAFEKTAYDNLLEEEAQRSIRADREIKKLLFPCVIRMKAINDGDLRDKVYDNFVKTLFYFNAGKKKKLGELFRLGKVAIKQWCGTDGDDHICLDKNNDRYSLFEDLQISEDTCCIPEEVADPELIRFIPELKVSYKNDKGSGSLNIDYPLFKMLKRLDEGYVCTVNDMNNHADFLGFVEKMLKIGKSDAEVIIVSNNGEKAVLKKTSFGFEFEVKK